MGVIDETPFPSAQPALMYACAAGGLRNRATSVVRSRTGGRTELRALVINGSKPPRINLTQIEFV
jgi:hypothetical protein